MTVHFHFAWDFARFSTSAVFHVVENGGGTDTLSYASGVYAHARPVAFVGDQSAEVARAQMKFPNDANATSAGSCFMSTLIDAMNASGGLAGTYELKSFAAGVYTVTSNTMFSFRGANTNVLAGMLIGADYSTTTAATFTSSYPVAFFKEGAHGALSDVTAPYEPDDIAADAETDANFGGGVCWSRPPLYQEFTAPMEAIDDVFARRHRIHAWSTLLAANSDNKNYAWSWEQAWQHCRNSLPFLVALEPSYSAEAQLTINESAGINTKMSVHKLRAEGARFSPQRAVADWDELWNLRFVTRVEETASFDVDADGNG